MKEYIVKIPEDSEGIITAVMEKFGVQATEIKKKKTLAKNLFLKRKRLFQKKKLIILICLGSGKILILMPKN